MKKALSVVIASSLIAASAISLAAETTETQTPAVQAPSVAQAPAVVMNPANPASFMGFINPATHQAYHYTAISPAQWGQFMQPQFYMQMADPAQMAQWMNPASYQVMMDPATYMYWMNPQVMMNEMATAPVAAANVMNPASYMAMANPATFTAWMNPAAYSAAPAQMTGPAGQNWFDMSAWTNMFQPAPQQVPQKDEG
jgi:hypothetical protein